MTTISNSNFSSYTSSLTLFMTLFAHKNSWYYNIKAINYFYNAYNTFTNYTKFTTLQSIEGIGRFIIFLGISTVCLNVQPINQLIMPINLYNIYYISTLKAKLVFSSLFFIKSFYYFHKDKYTFNRILDNQKVAYASMINWLFVL